MEFGGESRRVRDRSGQQPSPSAGDRVSSDYRSVRDRAHIDSTPARRPLSAFPELDCVRHRLPVAILSAAERRAREIGLSADRVLVTSGVLSEDAYLAALAPSLGVDFETLEETPRATCPLDDRRLIEAAALGFLPLQVDNTLTLVVAPRAMAARRLFELLGRSSELPSRVRLTSARRLRQFLARHGTDAIGRKAAYGLSLARPRFSAAAVGSPPILATTLGTMAVVTAILAAPQVFNQIIGASLALIFLAWTGLRLFGAIGADQQRRDFVRRPADQLPIYTIIVALYHEAAAVGGLIAALDGFDYPPEKLDIKLVLEPDDTETKAVLEAMNLHPSYEIVVAPDVGPRTKPKALNTALPFAHGTFTAVYDAEDRPEPDQLRRAVDAFLSGGDELACVQARLTIDNTADNWITRLFTAEYAGQFDVFLPGLAARRLPLPLGGSSNHFRTAVLREVGGWDPYNVTEDADLGMRLARFGYVTSVIASTTYEEAPALLGPWLKQRTRWFKGWMQTWLVHMRSPAALVRDLGWSGFLTFQLVVGGTVLAALVHPLFVGTFLYGVAAGGLFPDGEGVTAAILVGLYSGTFLAGYLASAVLGLVGLARRGLGSQGWALSLVPVHWALLSIAAWRALYKLVCDPYRWEKTQHGLARTSRLARPDRSISAVKNICADRPRRPRARV